MTYNDFAQLTIDAVASMTLVEKRAVVAYREEIMSVDVAALSLVIPYPLRGEMLDRIFGDFTNDLKLIGLIK